MKKIYCLFLSLACINLTGCTKKEDNVDNTNNNEVEQVVQTDEEAFEKLKKEEEEERIRKFKEDFFKSKKINLKNYEEVYALTQEISKQIKEFLDINKISYDSSNDNSFIVSKNYAYDKFDKNYIEFFMSNIDVNYNGGLGRFDLIIDKEFHKDLKINTEDSYIAFMYEIYKEFNNIEKEEFNRELNECINRVLNGSYNAVINGDGVIIKVSLDNTTLNIRLDMQKEIVVEPLELTTKEYSTIKEFENFGKNIFSGEKNINKVLLKNSNYRYTYLYEGFFDERFSEDIGFKYRQINKFKNYPLTTNKTVTGKVLNIDDKSYEYIDALIDKFNNDFGFYIKLYMNEKQFADEIQKLSMKQAVFSNDRLRRRYDLNIEGTLPIPGFQSLTLSNDIVSFRLKRDVKAEGIKGR